MLSVRLLVVPVIFVRMWFNLLIFSKQAFYFGPTDGDGYPRAGNCSDKQLDQKAS